MTLHSSYAPFTLVILSGVASKDPLHSLQWLDHCKAFRGPNQRENSLQRRE